MSIASCTQHDVTETPDHEVETLAELFDSLANRGAAPSHALYCYRDSTIDEYTIFMVLEDTMQMINKDNREWYRHAADNQSFLLRNATYLVEKLCKTAAESYRYSTPDSVDYSITIEKGPKKLLMFRHFKSERDNDCILLCYTIKRPTKAMPKPCDPKPVQTLLKQFLAEQKDVRQYPVHYEWEEGVPFPNEGEFYNAFTRYSGRGANCLAASLVTGTHYIIPVKGNKQADELENELCNRMIRLSTEQPVIGSVLQTSVRPGLEKKRLQRYLLSSIGKEQRQMVYQLKTMGFDNAFHILELNTANAPRFTIPLNWWTIMRTHNTRIFYREEYKDHI